MILNEFRGEDYKESFKKKFSNFGDKAPILISFATDDVGVTVVHENSGTRYFYAWDYTIPVKNLIHQIKTELSYKHYPRITREITKTIPLTPEQQAAMLANGVNINEIPTSETKTVVETYRIDKILALKDEFVILDEETGSQYVYHMNTSAIYFLKNYREGKFKDPKEAGDYFFTHSVLVDNLSERKS